MKSIIVNISISLLFYSCNQYSCDDLEVVDGKRYEVSTGELANGDKECLEIRNSGGASTHVTNYSYKNGLPSEKWTYKAQGQIIQSGEYINHIQLEEEINNLTKAKTIYIQTWFEGGFGELNIDIYSPSNPLDSINAADLVEKYVRDISIRYGLKQISFRQKIDGEWEYLSFSTDK
jgi:hypothetical protein